MDLKDKVAVITGGSGAIGAASAQRLAQAGARIVVGYNSKPNRQMRSWRHCPAPAIGRCASRCWKRR